MSHSQAQKILREKFIGRRLRVRTKNNRLFQGRLMGVDYKGNIILHESIAQIDAQHNCPLNYELENAYDQKIEYKPDANFSQEEKLQQTRQYIGTHYYFGAIMIAGNDLGKVQLLVPAVEQILVSEQSVNQQSQVQSQNVN